MWGRRNLRILSQSQSEPPVPLEPIPQEDLASTYSARRSIRPFVVHLVLRLLRGVDDVQLRKKTQRRHGDDIRGDPPRNKQVRDIALRRMMARCASSGPAMHMPPYLDVPRVNSSVACVQKLCHSVSSFRIDLVDSHP